MSSSPAQGSSKASLSPARSPSHSMSRRDVPLETLVTYLLASKRSLSSISTVWRANEIVQSARTALEDSVLLSARTAFFRTAIEGQCKVVRAVRRDVEKTYKEGERDFKVVIRHLDAANARLESTMDTLRSTMVEAAFRPAGEEPRSLLDFVDEQGVESMRDALKESIKESQEAKTEFDSSLLSFDNDIRAIISALKVSPSSPRSQSQMLSEESPLPGHLHELEGHAQEMASLLDSLVRHFDLCVSAIRHTEGGYAAVRKAASNTPEGAEPVSVSGVMNNETDAIEEPISEEERIEMVSIVENDAEQVEDVVQELRELVGEMEVKLEAIQDYVATRKSAYKSTIDAWTCLETVALRIPSYIIASHEYKAHWLEIKEGMATQMEELEHMRIFYESYHSSYDGLILEVARRKTSEDKVKSIMRKAMEQVKKVYEADMAERGAFREEVGEYLPNDLYPGVADLPPRWGVQVLEKSGELDAASGAGGSTPSLDMEVVEAAGRREKERMRQAHHR